jgi:hypothetical protein
MDTYPYDDNQMDIVDEYNEQNNAYMEEEEIGFWQFDKTDKNVCGSIFLMVIALIVILVLAKT